MLLQQQVFKLFAFSKIMKSPNSWASLISAILWSHPTHETSLISPKLWKHPTWWKNHLSCLSCLVPGKVMCGTWFWSSFKCCCVYEFDFIPWFLSNSSTTEKKKKKSNSVFENLNKSVNDDDDDLFYFLTLSEHLIDFPMFLFHRKLWKHS